jgi:replication fork clamp-binding protein CrfC
MCNKYSRLTEIHHQQIRAGEVITKLAEDAYFMRVNNRVAQVPLPHQKS